MVGAPAIAIWIICLLCVAAVLLQPRGWPMAIWPVLGALILVLSSLLPLAAAGAALGQGSDVYLFLVGMLLLAELARREGVFDWLAALATRWARGSATRLFTLVYGVGVVVTVLLSNDATAVVLTPAVCAAARRARAEPLPYLYICAFVANAASFVLPISNPANLVVFQGHMPRLSSWLLQFSLPSLLSIGATYAVLRVSQRAHLVAPIACDVSPLILSRSGRLVAQGVLATALLLIIISSAGLRLGAPTFSAGALIGLIVTLKKRETPWPLLSAVQWGVIPLVAGLFVLVAAVQQTGLIAWLGAEVQRAAQIAPRATVGEASILVALGLNLINNLPAGLMVGSVTSSGALPASLAGALLIAVDVGPNLSVTGSLATILWLAALRRERQSADGMDFFKLGCWVMFPALLLSVGAILLFYKP